MEKILPVEIKKIHFVGIGGIGMSGLAKLLADKGYTISGSDIRENEIIRKLIKKRIKIDIPHRGLSVREKDLVCFSSAIGEDNPEIKMARSLKIPLVKRGVLLGRILKGKAVVAVAGSHGKTTTTSLGSFVLRKIGKDIASLVGGIPRYSPDSSWWGKDLFIVETDESDASFLEIEPSYALITNIDKEHVDFYGGFGKLREAFLDFAKSTQNLIIGCGDRKEVLDLLKKSRKDFITYGFSSGNIFSARDIRLSPKKSSFKLCYKNRPVFKVETPLLGRHNVLNSLAILSLCWQLGLDMAEVIRVIKEFPGTRRRLEFKAKVRGVVFIDDYAHHPKEIEAVMGALAVFKRRLVVLFQPHRYSRTKNLISEFPQCFKGAGSLIITDIYSAGEKTISGITPFSLMEKIRKNFKKDIVYIPERALAEKVPSLLKPGDCLVSLGAGSINKIQERIIERFACKTRRG